MVDDLEHAPEPADPVPFAWPTVADRVDAEVLRRASRDPSEPVVPAEISQIVRQLADKLREEFRTLVAQAPWDDTLATRLAQLERDFEPHRRFGKWVAGVAGAALLAVGIFLYHRGQSEQLVTDEIKAVREKADRCETKIDQLKDPRP